MGRANLYLHIGWHKTGTTALQHLLMNNKSLLEQKGYLYPSTGLENSAHYALAWSLDSSRQFSVSAKEMWGQLKQEVGASKAQHVILSSEDFITLKNLEELRRVTENYNVKIIVYLRRQDSLVQSVYNQLVREPSRRLTVTIQDFIQQNLYNVHRYMDFGRCLEIWKDNFGKNNIIVRVYEKAQLPKGIFADFLSAIGLELTDEYVLPEEKAANISFDLDILEFLRLWNSVPMTASEYLKLVATLGNLPQKIEGKSSERRFLLSPQERVELLQRYKESNSQVAREYLGRDDEQLFREPWPDPDESWEPYPGLSIEKAIQIVAEIKAEQLAKTGGSKQALLQTMNKQTGDIREVGPAPVSMRVLNQIPDWMRSPLITNYPPEQQTKMEDRLQPQEYNNQLQEQQAQLHQLKIQLQLQEMTLQQQDQELHKLRAHLNDIYQTRAWRLATKYWTFKSKLQDIIQPHKFRNLSKKAKG